MERKYLKDLIDWVNDPNRKPLLVWGARQVGKSYLLRQLFAEKYFKNKYIYVDCKMDSTFTEAFKDDVNPKHIIDFLEIKTGINIDRSTLLIFDEVQECPSLVTSLKYFCQDFREIPVIATGSMVRMKIKRISKDGNPFLYPIGKVDSLTIHPLNFEEFLFNYNKKMYEFIVEFYQNKIPLEESYHKMAFEIFYKYLSLGGMPEVVDIYLNTHSYNDARKRLINIYDDYLNDMSLYQTSNETLIRTKSVFENIYNQLNKENKNFKVSFLENNSRNRSFETPIEWLEFSSLITKSKSLKDRVTIPFMSDNDSIYRIYLNDVGIFAYQSKVNGTSFILENQKNSLSGIFFENYIATEMNNFNIPLYYWMGKNDAEFEFVVQDGKFVVPINVKKKNGKLNSLTKFKEHNKFSYCVKFSQANYGFDTTNGILTIPLYMAFLYFKEISLKQ